METQFEKNPQFRTIISAQSGADLRSHPLGKDKLGNAYWSTLDEQCNLRIYQEHLDEEIWKVVATNRDELVKLIACLKGNELVMPSLVGLVDEDSSSNSVPDKVDTLNGGAAAPTDAAAPATAAATPTTTNVKDEVKTEPPDGEVVRCEGSLNLRIKLKTSSGESEIIKTEPAADATTLKSDKTDEKVHQIQIFIVQKFYIKTLFFAN